MLSARCATFQSTLPIRGATQAKQTPENTKNISIHAPHTGSDEDMEKFGLAEDISIHAPHTGSDGVPNALKARAMISIHAPHTGSDWLVA